MALDRRDLRRRLFNLASGQGGYFTAAQAIQLGYSYQAQAYHVTAGNWVRVDRGLFRLTEWVPDVHDDLARWTLWSKGRAVVSHESALAVHEIGEFESSKVHLTVPTGFTMRDDALALHVADLDDDDVQQRTGFRVTSPTRTIIDIAGQAPDEDQLARAIAEADSAGLVTPRGLRSRAEVLDARAALYIERAIGKVEPS
ncbi:MAG TPA: type IV toxin-antitoxin system AbiEi family antitoxin domain-containing protein [Acidimicrobiales bacterium]|jgi:predicted transcriptional regulator of viral defense system